MFNFMREVSDEIINPWLNTNLSNANLVSEEFSDDRFIESFSREVVEKIGKKHDKDFTVHKRR